MGICYLSVGSSHGSSPASIATSTIPQLQISAGGAWYPTAVITSGAAYGGVPHRRSIFRVRPAKSNGVKYVLMANTSYCNLQYVFFVKNLCISTYWISHLDCVCQHWRQKCETNLLNEFPSQRVIFISKICSRRIEYLDR